MFRSKEELQELEEQLKGQNNNVEVPSPTYKERKVYQPPKNGFIFVNSVVAKLEPFNEEFIENKSFSLESSLGRQLQISSTLTNPGR